jgi:hypothetical protein
MELSNSERRQQHEWSQLPLDSFMEFFDEHRRILDLNRFAALSRVNEPERVRALLAWEAARLGEDKDYAERVGGSRLAQAESLADFAKQQVDSGFTIIHLHGCVLLCAALETLVRDTVIAVLLNDPDSGVLNESKKVKIQYSTLLLSSAEDRAGLFVEGLESDAREQKKYGFYLLLALLERVGLGGQVNDSLERNLKELWATRNLAAHKRGRIDKQFLEICPWITQSIGERILVDHEKYSQMEAAAIELAFAIDARLGKRYGWEALGGYGVAGGLKISAVSPTPME